MYCTQQGNNAFVFCLFVFFFFFLAEKDVSSFCNAKGPLIFSTKKK